MMISAKRISSWCVFQILLIINTAATKIPVCSNQQPQVRRFRFVVENYSTMGPACDACPDKLNACKSNECITADGIQRSIIAVNRKMPGPVLEVCHGDTVVVDVENRMIATETAIHWYGIQQLGTPYMDGVPFVTQCPISEGATFRYSFIANDLGTYFWHSHHGVQKMDGFIGSLIVRSIFDPSLGLYDTDHHVITLQDWVHDFTQSKMPGPINMAKRGQQTDSILINGRGRFIDPVTGSSTKTPFAEIKVQAGLRHRMRIINMGSFECPFHFQVEGHNLSVIAVDGFPTMPETVDSIILLPGERVDVVLTADQPNEGYWIIVKALGKCAKSEIYQKAVLLYENAISHRPATPDPGYEAFPSGLVLNPMQAKCKKEDQGICAYQLQSFVSRFYQDFKAKSRDVTLLKFAFNLHNYKLKNLFKQSSLKNQPFYIPLQGDERTFIMQAGQINNISMVLPPSPPLSQPDVKKEITNKNYGFLCSSSTSKHQNCMNYQHAPLNNVVDILFVHDAELKEGEAFPFHLHGYKFNILYQGYSLRDCMDDSRFNPNPVLKDTVNIPAGGIARIRFKADNPGFWLLHCNFLFHQVTGMSVLLNVGEEKHLPPVPRGFPACGSFIPQVKLRPEKYTRPYRAK